MATIVEAGELTAFLAGIFKEYAAEHGISSLRNKFENLGFSATAIEAAYAKDPVGTTYAITAGIMATIVLGAAITEVGAAAAIAISLDAVLGTSLANAVATAVVATLVDNGTQTVFYGAKAALGSIVNSIGGTFVPQSIGSNSCTVTPLQAPAGSNLLLLVPETNNTIQQYFMNFPYTVPSIAPNSLTISTNGNNLLTLDQNAWANVSYNGLQLVANLLNSNNQANGSLTVNTQNEEGILTAASGQTLLNIIGSSSFDVNNGNGKVTIDLGGLPTGTLQATLEGVSENTDGSLSFTDALGKNFANYTAGQLTGGSIKVNGNEIDAYNAGNQLQNSTQEVQLGSSNFGVLDKTYQSQSAAGNYNITTVDDPNVSLYTYPSGAVVGGTYLYGANNTGTVVGDYTAASGEPGLVITNGTLSTLVNPHSGADILVGANDSGMMIATSPGSINQDTSLPVTAATTLLLALPGAMIYLRTQQLILRPAQFKTSGPPIRLTSQAILSRPAPKKALFPT